MYRKNNNKENNMSLDIGVKLPTTQVSTGDFFNHLSTKDGLIYGKGFDRQFHIVRNAIALNGQKYTVSESSTPWRVHPLRLFMKPQAGQGKVSDTANLVALVKEHKANIVGDSANNVARITAAFERMSGKMVLNTTATEAAAITKNFAEAASLLRNEAVKQGVDAFQAGGPLAGGSVVSSSQFYKDLTHTWRPFKLNKHFQIVEPKGTGHYEVRYTGKRWFFQKWAQFPRELTTLKFWKDMKPSHIPGAAKVAMAEKLGEMVLRDRDLIRYMQPDTGAMIANLERIKGRIVKHTNPQEQKRIEAGFDKAIGEIKKLGFLVRKDQNNSWTRWVWNHTAAPMGNLAFAGSKLALRLTLAGIKAPFKLIWSATK